MNRIPAIALLAALPASALSAQVAAGRVAPSPRIQFVAVDKDVKLEVVDWGGSGRPVVLLAGLGSNAHAFDKFALKLTPAYHVYGITRRGFSPSSAPPSGYSADRLGDDVVAVVETLHLNRPVLVGHSIAGEELSSIGSRHPEKVAGLVYLDAGYSYAYYNGDGGDLNIDLGELRKQLEQLTAGNQPHDPRQLIQELLDTSLPRLENDLRQLQRSLEASPPPPPSGLVPPEVPDPSSQIMAGMQKYTDIHGPVLAIYALPGEREAATLAQANAFKKGVPSARVIGIRHANHFVFISNEADVLREMNAFIAGLP